MGDLWDDDDGQSWDFVADIDKLVERHNKEQFQVRFEPLLTTKQLNSGYSMPGFDFEGKGLLKGLLSCHLVTEP